MRHSVEDPVHEKHAVKMHRVRVCILYIMKIIQTNLLFLSHIATIRERSICS